MKFETNEELWNLMGELPVPEPSGEMQANFNAMLESYKTSERVTARPVADFWRLFWGRPWMAAAFTLILLIGGFGLGYFVHRPGAPVVITTTVHPPVAQTPPTSGQPATTQPVVVQSPPPIVQSSSATADRQQVVNRQQPDQSSDRQQVSERQQLDALTTQVHEMREMMMLALLQNPSASERMRAVSYTDGIKHVNANMTDALLATLNNDPNVNVRLTTLDALSHFAGNPAVREGLVQSILQQDSPLVQAALADVMLKLQERRAVKAFKKLLQQKDLNSTVRTKIEQTITRLI
jgi:HEAT repeats